MKPEELAETR